MRATSTTPDAVPDAMPDAMPDARPGRWRVWVTDDDIRQATDAWLSAIDGGAPEDRVEDLRLELQRLWRAEASQVTIDA